MSFTKSSIIVATIIFIVFSFVYYKAIKLEEKINKIQLIKKDSVYTPYGKEPLLYFINSKQDTVFYIKSYSKNMINFSDTAKIGDVFLIK